MAKSAVSSANNPAYQKYFDARSLKSVASCAAIVFIIVHLVDYLGNYSISIRILDILTLSLCLVITFLFVVNELIRPEEKIILGIANAALLFFSVIGFNSTMTSSVFRNPKPLAREAEHDTIRQPHSYSQPANQVQYASILPGFRIRNLMPSAEQEQKVQALTIENAELLQKNKALFDTLFMMKKLGNPVALQVDSTEYFRLTHQVDSLQKQVARLTAELKKSRYNPTNPTGKTKAESPIHNNEAGIMDKTDYINNYKTMKLQFDMELKKCKQEANEYRTKYNLLMRGSKRMIEDIK